VRKKTFISLVLLPILLSGCIIISSNKTPAPPQECTKTPQTNATIAEIDAAGKLISQSAQANVYKAIAQRPGLTQQERIYLTNAATKHLISESAKEEILLILVNNHPPAVEPLPKLIEISDPKETTSQE
jgi:hypothetical protein